MLKRTTALRVRLPKCRRPRERPWEVLNTRNFGMNEGAENPRMIGFFTTITFMIVGYEAYHQWGRVKARGDSCPACEAARGHYRERIREKEAAMKEALQQQ